MLSRVRLVTRQMLANLATVDLSFRRFVADGFQHIETRRPPPPPKQITVSLQGVHWQGTTSDNGALSSLCHPGPPGLA